MDRVFLAIVGTAYLGLGFWCSLMPAKTARSVGFVLEGGQGRSEFFTVYGGLELGLGLMFLVPLIRPETAQFALLSCVIVHACLVLARCVSLVVYSEFARITFVLAAVEWVIFLVGAIVLWRSNVQTT